MVLLCWEILYNSKILDGATGSRTALATYPTRIRLAIGEVMLKMILCYNIEIFLSFI
jgi:hypothetical protein